MAQLDEEPEFAPRDRNFVANSASVLRIKGCSPHAGLDLLNVPAPFGESAEANMKPLVALAACLGGCTVGCLLAAFLGVATDPANMDCADHRMVYRLFPVLGVVLAVAVAAHAFRSRVAFWASLVAALASLLVPEPNPGHARYANLEGAAMASLHQTFLHSATLASTLPSQQV